MILNNPLNWILPWNEWMNHILNRYLPFLMKSPLFCLFWTLFGQFSHSTSINDPLTIELNNLLNWISRFFLNWIIFWIESWVKQYWIEYWMNHFLAKFKHWIESDRVSNTPISRTGARRTAFLLTQRVWSMFPKGEIQALMILDVFDKIGTSKSLGSWRDAAQSADGDSGDKIERLGTAFPLSPMQECLRLEPCKRLA